MKFLTVNSGRLVEMSQWQHEAASGQLFSTGTSACDELYGPGLRRSAVHELLYPAHSARPMLPAMLLARAASESSNRTPDRSPPGGAIVISDPQHHLYPPAAAQLGIPLSRLYLLHPKNREEELWALSECLASGGCCAVVAELGKLSQVEARRLQLAAERGGSLGLWIRPAGAISSIYAAAVRLLVEPIPATMTGCCQRWMIQLLHGHGCQVGKSIVLEYNREEHTVHSISKLADHQAAAEAIGGTTRRIVA
jgi:hypothetical protein